MKFYPVKFLNKAISALWLANIGLLAQEVIQFIVQSLGHCKKNKKNRQSSNTKKHLGHGQVFYEQLNCENHQQLLFCSQN